MIRTINRWYLKMEIASMYRDLDKIKGRTARDIRHGGIIMQDIADLEAKLRILDRR